MPKLPVNASNLKKKVESFKNKTVELIKENRNLVQNFMDAYFLDELITNKIHNDLGASFTTFKRRGERITKKAKPEGEKKLIDEINWNLMFKDKEFSKYLPKIYKYSKKPGRVFVQMKYYNYPNLRKLIFNDLNPKFFLKKRWEFILDLLQSNLFTARNSYITPDDFVQKTYFDKLKTRIAETIVMAPYMKELIALKDLKINGKRYLNLEPIILGISKDEEIFRLLKPELLYYSHGDLHSNNILCGVNYKSNIFIDCRGKSPYGDLYFDVAYDIGKLYHDLNSYYSLIENHLYNIMLYKNGEIVEIEYEFINEALVKKFEFWHNYVNGLIKNKYTTYGNLEYRAKFNEAILYLTMIPFHLKRKSEAIMCFITGIIRLNEWLERYHPEKYKELSEKK